MFKNVTPEYFDMDHAEPVPTVDFSKQPSELFYLPMHAVMKESSTTTKIHAVFDASAKSSSGVSLNDQLCIGPTVHPTLVDVLLQFCLLHVALTSDVSHMYRAVLLPPDECDLHRFAWREQPNEVLRDYHITRVTFGVASSSYTANMAAKQNAIDHAQQYPLATSAVHQCFYVDDGLCDADSPTEAIELQRQQQELFAQGGILLQKWRSSEPTVLQNIPPSPIGLSTIPNDL